MAPKQTYNEPGHVHELTFSCYKMLPLLRDKRHCKWLSDSIEEARKRHDFALLAYVFMPEHVHLLIYPNTTPFDVSAILSSIKVPVAKRALARMRRVSDPRLETLRLGEQCRFWQPGGGYDRNLYSTKALKASIDYIHLNPVRRGLVDHPASYRWSSAAFYYSGSSEALRVDAQLAP